MAELRPYNPTLRDRLAAALMGDSKSPSRRAFVEGALGSTGLGMSGPGPGGTGLVDFIPGGQIFAIDEAARDADPQAAGIAGLPVALQLALALQREEQENPDF